MMLHPDILLDLARFQQQERLREAERRRLAREARPHRAKFWQRLSRRWVAFAGKQLRLPAFGRLKYRR